MEMQQQVNLWDAKRRTKKYFNVSAAKYVRGKDFEIYRPASLNDPADHAVMFIGESYISKADIFEQIRQCLVFWPENIEVPEPVMRLHAVVKCKSPRLEYCLFYRENKISNIPCKEKGGMENSAFVAFDAVTGRDVSVMPGAYVGAGAWIGDRVYIGAGAKIIGDVFIGDDSVIRENAVIGADGLSTDRDLHGQAATMPQFGGVIIEKNVQIGAGTVIARGAIDCTVIHQGVKIDNHCFISHNVEIGEDTFVVGETIMFGSSSTGKRVCLSGNSTIRNGVHIGDDALVGMGAVVTGSVENGKIVKGNPAKE